MEGSKIKIFTVGGSIDKRYDTAMSQFVVSDPIVETILLEANVSTDFEVESLYQKDSLDLTDGDRQVIRERVAGDPNRLIIITHGTDTMVETARALESIPDKVIVVTGAMQPAAFKKTDAAVNVGGALVAVQTLPEGVYIVMSGRVFNPDSAVKNQETDQFEQ